MEPENIEELGDKTPSLATDLTGAKRVGSDEFFYDIFGVNLKGLQSIWILIRSPAEYFAAAQLPDWGGTHWPSIRIWMGLMGILAAFQFVWASESSEMTAMFQMLAMQAGEGFQRGAANNDMIVSLEGLDKKALGKRAFQLWALIYPFFFIAAMCALAFIFRPWKPAGSFVIRLRYLFAIIIPGSVFGILSTFLLTSVRGSLYQALSLASAGILLLLYTATAYRGPFAHWERGERIGLSIVTAVMLMIFIMTAQIVSMLVAVIPVGIDVIETLSPQLEAAKAASN